MNQTESSMHTQQYALKLTKHAVEDDETGVFKSLTLVPDSTYYLVRTAVTTTHWLLWFVVVIDREGGVSRFM